MTRDVLLTQRHVAYIPALAPLLAAGRRYRTAYVDSGPWGSEPHQITPYEARRGDRDGTDRAQVFYRRYLCRAVVLLLVFSVVQAAMPAVCNRLMGSVEALASTPFRVAYHNGATRQFTLPEKLDSFDPHRIQGATRIPTWIFEAPPAQKVNASLAPLASHDVKHEGLKGPVQRLIISIQHEGEEPTVLRAMEFDKHGFLLVYVEFEPAAQPQSLPKPRWIHRYQQHPDSSRTRIAYDPDGTIRYVHRMVYDSGKLVEQAEYFGEGMPQSKGVAQDSGTYQRRELQRRWTFVYNAQGQLTREEEVRADGKEIRTTVHDYDQQGHRVTTSDGPLVTRFVYDRAGNLVEEIPPFPRTKKHMSYERFDAMGNWTRATLWLETAPGSHIFQASELTRTIVYHSAAP